MVLRKKLLQRPLSVGKSTSEVPNEPPKIARVNAKYAASIVQAVRTKVKSADVTLASDGDVLADVKEWIPTGFSGLDHIFGGGWPVGRASEVAGSEGCGKSALAQLACVQTQILGGLVVYLDFERALDKKKMTKLGMDPNGLLYLAPDHLEQAWDVIWSLVAELEKKPPTAPTLIVMDSVGGALAKSQMEGSAEDQHVGAVARVMTPNCARLFKAIQRVRAHMLFINQERAAFGTFAKFGPPPKKTPGGEALRFAASLRVRCTRVATLKAGGDSGLASGYLIKTSTDKNRLVPPHRKATWVLDFTVGPSPELTLFEGLKDAGRLVRVPNTSDFKMRGYKGAAVSRADWPTRLVADGAFRAHVDGLYTDLLLSGLLGKAPTESTPE